VKGEVPDWRFSKVLAICLLCFFACVAIMVLTPVSEGGVDDTVFRGSFAAKIVVPPVPPKALPKIAKEKLQGIAIAPGRSNGTAKAKAKVAALLQFWDEGTRGLFGGSNNNAIDDALNRIGPGGPPGADNGFGGVSGPRGGDGPGRDGLSIGGGPFGKRPGGGGGPSLGPKRGGGPESGPINISDGLPRDLVAKVIRAHFNEIKFCYERELQHTEGLAGKVGVFFVIGPLGEVLEARVAESTLDNPTVEECMLSRVRRWKFPEPAGGGTVEVNHPWIFRGAGDNDP
jgi:TonB family protein